MNPEKIQKSQLLLNPSATWPFLGVLAWNVGPWEAAITPRNMSGGLGRVGKRVWAG